MSFHKNNIELAGTVTAGPKGQVVIPADVRERMAVQAGDKMIALYMPDTKAISFVTEGAMQAIIDRMGSHVEALRTKLQKG